MREREGRKSQGRDRGKRNERSNARRAASSHFFFDFNLSNSSRRVENELSRASSVSPSPAQPSCDAPLRVPVTKSLLPGTQEEPKSCDCSVVVRLPPSWTLVSSERERKEQAPPLSSLFPFPHLPLPNGRKRRDEARRVLQEGRTGAVRDPHDRLPLAQLRP